VVVGFGTYRETLGRFVDAIGRRNLETLHEIAARGRELEGGPPGELKYLNAFLERAGKEWLGAAPPATARIHFTGRIGLDALPGLLPVCEAQVMPSPFPEAFGMVAAEAAACGALPLCARHSGMAVRSLPRWPPRCQRSCGRSSRSKSGPEPWKRSPPSWSRGSRSTTPSVSALVWRWRRRWHAATAGKT